MRIDASRVRALLGRARAAERECAELRGELDRLTEVAEGVAAGCRARHEEDRAELAAALARIEELGEPAIERAVRTPGCAAWRNSDGTLPTNVVDGEVVERRIYYTPWVAVDVPVCEHGIPGYHVVHDDPWWWCVAAPAGATQIAGLCPPESTQEGSSR